MRHSNARRASERRKTIDSDRRRVPRGGRRAGEGLVANEQYVPLPVPEAAVGRPPLVLVVDHYPDAREMTTEYLRLSGFRVADVGTGREAIEQAAVLRPDVILLDLVLQDMDGWEVISQLKAAVHTKRITIAVQTTNVTPDSRQRTRAAGIDLFLPKPCDMARVAVQLASAIDTTAQAPM